MGSEKDMTREERLAAKLRENLRRRKAQARALDGVEDDAAQAPAPDSGADSSAPLSKEVPSL